MKRNPRLHQLSSLQLKRALVQASIDAMESNGWDAKREPGITSSSVRRITRVDDEGRRQSLLVTIRTSQNGSVAFTRDAADTGWTTLREVDSVIVSCVDDPKKPVCAIVQAYHADKIELAFDKAYGKRKKAGTAVKPGTGVWLPVYELELDKTRSSLPQRGIFKRNETFIELSRYILLESHHAEGLAKDREKYFLTIPEARRRLALTLGVHESEINIFVKSSKTRRDSSRR